MKHSFEELITHIQQLEADREELSRSNRSLSHRLKAEEAKVAALTYKAKTVQTLSSGLVSLLDVPQIYSMICESLVYQLGWDTAFILTGSGGKITIQASYQATSKQVDQVKAQLGKAYPFLEAYAQRTAFSTLQSNQKDALLLRSIFHTDEVVLMPLVFADQSYGMIAVCSHSQPRHASIHHDLSFLSEVAGLVATSIHMSNTLAELETKNKELEKKDELKNTFISITSHQLRTPLSIMKWILSILQTDPEFSSLKRQTELVDQAYESNERLIHVVNDLLSVSRITNGELPYDPQPVDLAEIIKDIVNGSKRVATPRKLKIKIEIESALPLVEADPLLIREAIQNLVSNAIDYSHEGGMVIVTAAVEKGRIEMKVANEGPGISGSDEAHIFEQFYRSPEAKRLQPTGSGLGLYLCKMIIERHKGRIGFTSAEGITTFVVTLPVSKQS